MLLNYCFCFTLPINQVLRSGPRKENKQSTGGVCGSLQVLYRFGCRREVFDAKKEPKRYPEQTKWSQKESQNQPRNLQRHPCGTWSKKYRKCVPKDANLGALSWIKIDTNFKKILKTNHISVTKKPDQ